MRTLLLLAALVVTPGCVMSRTYFNESLATEAIARLVPGESTAAEVVAALGAPNEVVQLGRRSAYRYEHTQKKLAGVYLIVVFLINEDNQSDRTWVFFDENDRLTHMGTTLQAEEVEYAMPWSSRD